MAKVSRFVKKWIRAQDPKASPIASAHPRIRSDGPQSAARRVLPGAKTALVAVADGAVSDRPRLPLGHSCAVQAAAMLRRAAGAAAGGPDASGDARSLKDGDSSTLSPVRPTDVDKSCAIDDGLYSSFSTSYFRISILNIM